MPDNNPISRLNGEELVFVFDGMSYKVLPEQDLRINEDDLSEEFVRQPSHFAYIAILTSKADTAVKIRKMELDQAEAKAYDLALNNSLASGNKYTVDALRSKVSLNPDVIIAQKKMVDAQADLSMLKGLEEAFRIRADMLIQIGMRQRSEMENGELSIKSRNHPNHHNPEAAAKEAIRHAALKDDDL